jgi:hypothetical protein
MLLYGEYPYYFISRGYCHLDLRKTARYFRVTQQGALDLLYALHEAGFITKPEGTLWVPRSEPIMIKFRLNLPRNLSQLSEGQLNRLDELEKEMSELKEWVEKVL